MGDRLGSLNFHFSLENTFPIFARAEEVIGLIVLTNFCLGIGISVTALGITSTPEWSLGTPPLDGSSTSIGGIITGSWGKKC